MLTLICKTFSKGGLTMIINCKFAFNSEEEKNEWQNLLKELNHSDNFPLEHKINCSENIDRLKRHGYVVTLSYSPNVYEIKKMHK